MAIDSSIYGMIRPQQQGPGPLEQYAQMAQVRGLMDANELNALKRSELERDIASQGKIRDLFSRGNVRPEEVMAIDPAKGLTYQKNMLETQKGEADLLKTDRENFIAFADEARKRLPMIRDNASLAQFRDEQIQRAGMFSTKAVRETAMRAAASIPTVFDPHWIQSQVVKAEDLFTPKPQVVERPDGSKVTVDMNPFTNPQVLNMNMPRAMTPAQETTAAHQDATLTETRTHNRATEGNAAGQLKIARETAKLQQDKLREEIQAGKANKEGAIASYDTAIGTLDRLTKHPGFTQTVGGALIPGQRFVPGTDAANFDAELKAFKAQVFLPMVQNLRGMGALSEAEGTKLTDAVGALSTSMSEKAFKDSVGRIKADLNAAKARIGGQPPPARPPAAPAAPAPKPPKEPSLGGGKKGGIKFLGFEGA